MGRTFLEKRLSKRYQRYRAVQRSTILKEKIHMGNFLDFLHGSTKNHQFPIRRPRWVEWPVAMEQRLKIKICSLEFNNFGCKYDANKNLLDARPGIPAISN